MVMAAGKDGLLPMIIAAGKRPYVTHGNGCRKDGLLPMIIAAGKDRALQSVIINRCTKMLLANNGFRMQEKTTFAAVSDDNRWRKRLYVYTHRDSCSLVWLNLFNAESSPGEVVAGTEIPGGEGRGRLYLTPHCCHQNVSSNSESNEIHFNVSLNTRDNVRRQCPQTTTFED